MVPKRGTESVAKHRKKQEISSNNHAFFPTITPIVFLFVSYFLLATFSVPVTWHHKAYVGSASVSADCYGQFSQQREARA